MKWSRAIAVFLLGFLGVTAIVGAVPLIRNPHAEPWQMPQSFLEHSPFHSYLIPGIILLLANGILSFFALYQTVRCRPGYGWWVALQGGVLSGWIVVEVIMLRFMVWPHYVYLGLGLALIGLGLALTRDTPAI